jgi:SpoVK/Ycf46/Vps4 family AAA+-type ATPase
MTTTAQLLTIIRAYADRDDQLFFAVVEAIAADAEKAGHSKVAADVRTRMATVLNMTSVVEPVLPVKLSRDLSELMTGVEPRTRLSDLVLSDALELRLRRIFREHEMKDALAEKKLRPSRKLLLSGPPGTGKTITAAAIAGEMGLPLFTVQLHGVITKFMGETAAKLRIVFDAIAKTRGVYFFDEIDALASDRGSDNDVGEARRMLNSLLQFLEQDQSDSMIVAATNHPELMDRAIFRRFDSRLVYGIPQKEHIGRIIREALPLFAMTTIDWTEIEREASGLSQADLVASSHDAARDTILEGDDDISTETFVESLRDKQALHGLSLRAHTPGG